MSKVEFKRVDKIEVGDVIATGAGTRQTIVAIEVTGAGTNRQLNKVTFEDFAGYRSHGFYRPAEEMLVEK